MALFVEEAIVVPMLAKMFLPRHVMLDLVTKIGGERANVREHEPSNVIGFETWRWGTRLFREEETLKGLGWSICDRDQVAGIRHNEARIKLVCCGTDQNTATEKSPKNLSERGSSSRKLIALNSGQFRMDFIKEEPRDDLWYYCPYFCDKFISLEISRPVSEINGIITKFSDRIVIAKPGEIPGIRRFSVPQEFADVPKPQVRRK